ncbi:MAG: succinate dehydrogenase iron-sulfur subunit [Nitrospirae bacterium]|nr:succinate dehydrogenase iron-sulfur subunit [Nitrospirota bacterium]
MGKYRFKIKRFNQEEDSSPRWEEFALNMEPAERVLDGLIKIKDKLDGSLTFRHSCEHGICGSCAMKINGENRLSCQTLIKDVPQRIVIEPLPAFKVIKDVVTDMEIFFNATDNVSPYLINPEEPPGRERLQSPDEHEKILESVTCIMCGCCTSACPSYWADKSYLGPSTLLKAYRFAFDSRDRAMNERLDAIDNPHGLWRCHNIFNCVEVCPKEINVTWHISQLKKKAVARKLPYSRKK